jgi:hypothetical protein
MAVRKLSLPLFTRKDRSLLPYISLRLRPQKQEHWYRGILDIFRSLACEVYRRLEPLAESPAQAF